jgi:hypothetical protein
VTLLSLPKIEKWKRGRRRKGERRMMNKRRNMMEKTIEPEKRRTTLKNPDTFPFRVLVSIRRISSGS